MSSVKDLSKVINSLKHLATNIIEKNLELMIDISDEEADIILDIQDAVTKIHEKEEKEPKIVPFTIITDAILEFSVFNASNAEHVTEELDFFSNRLVKGKMDKDELCEKCPFLSSVWYGDYFDAKSIKSLVSLEKELMEQLKNTNEQVLIEIIVNKLKHDGY